MRTKFHKIENVVSRPTFWFNLEAVMYDCEVSFSSSIVAGDAYLRVYEPLRGIKHQEVALNRELMLELSVEGETEVTDLDSTNALQESIKPLGPRGHFEIIASLQKHWNSQDTEFAVCDVPFHLWTRNFPEGTLEIVPGNLVRIRTQRLTLVTVATMCKNCEGEPE